MRPRSHRSQEHARRCGNCIHAHRVECRGDLLCFHGDEYVVQPSCFFAGRTAVLLHGEPVSLMGGEEYSTLWGSRVVTESDVCDEWATLRW